MARFRRKDLKRPDQFVSTTRQAIVWADDNRRQVTIAAGVVLAVVLIIAGTMAVRSARARQANDELAQGLAQLHNDKYVEAAVQLNDAGLRWEGTVPGTAALLYSAQANVLAKNLDGAAGTAARVAEKGSGPKYLTQQAVLTLAFVKEDKGDFAKAAEEYAKARSMTGPYGSVALLGEARTRDRTGDKAKAIELYQAFLDEYPESKDEAFASTRLAALKAG